MTAAPKKYIGKITSDTMLSCSRLPALMGMSQYETPSDLLRSVTSAIEAGDNHKRDDRVPSEAAHWGNQTEGMILAEGCRRLGLRDPELEVTEPVIHPTLPLQGSLDGRADGAGLTFTTDPEAGIYVIGQDEITLEGMGVLEAKNTSHYPEDEPALNRGPIQCQGLMMCTGYKWSAIFVLYRGTEMRCFLYAPDPATIAKIEADAIEFESRVETFRLEGVVDWYPAFSANDAATMYARAEPEQVIDFDESVSDKVLELIDAKRAQKAVTELISKLQGEIMDVMGNHEHAVAYEDGRAVATVRWGMTSARNYKARAAYRAEPSRSKSLSVKEIIE
jgi:hypothetical protein